MIYKIENFIDIKIDIIEVEIIKFIYLEMGKGKVKLKDKNYDLEVFVEYKCNFYLFIKNRIKFFDGIIKLYKVGDYVVNFDV